MKNFPNLVICEYCDAAYRRRVLRPGEAAQCDRCGALLYRAGRQDVDRWLALTIAAAVVDTIANICPVVHVSLEGRYSDATLWQAACALAHGTAAPIAVPAAVSMIVAPFLQIVLLGWVLIYARQGRRAPGFGPAMRLLHVLRPWSMIEVAMLGILVAVIKMSGLLEVTPKAGLWATMALMVLITLIGRRDLRWLWDRTEART